jgi:hypothetical protein
MAALFQVLPQPLNAAAHVSSANQAMACGAQLLESVCGTARDSSTADAANNNTEEAAAACMELIAVLAERRALMDVGSVRVVGPSLARGLQAAVSKPNMQARALGLANQLCEGAAHPLLLQLMLQHDLVRRRGSVNGPRAYMQADMQAPHNGRTYHLCAHCGRWRLSVSAR